MALSAVTQETLFLRQLLPVFADCLIQPPHTAVPDLSMVLPPTQIWEDNQGAIHMATNQVTSARTKHIDIDIRHHFVREQLSDASTH